MIQHSAKTSYLLLFVFVFGCRQGFIDTREVEPSDLEFTGDSDAAGNNDDTADSDVVTPSDNDAGADTDVVAPGDNDAGADQDIVIENCGNGVLDPGETCDPPASCVTACNDGNPCTADTRTGSAQTCTASCTHEPLTAVACDDGVACTDNDQCLAGTCVGGASLCAELPRGSYVMWHVRDALTPAVTQIPGLVGVNLRVFWSEVEAQQGVFDWSGFDARIQEAEQADLAVTLVVSNSPKNSPAWIVEHPSVQTLDIIDTNANHHDTFCEVVPLPLFWDPTYHAARLDLIRVMAARYAARPSILGVNVSFANAYTDDWNIPAKTGTVPNCPITLDQPQQWLDAGYTPDKIVNIGKEMIDLTAELFPWHAIKLPISHVANSLDDPTTPLIEQILDYAYAAYPQRMFAESHALSAHWPMASPSDNNAIRAELMVRAPRIGLQMLASAARGDTDNCRLNAGVSPCPPAETLQAVVDIGVSYDPHYFEYWTIDGKTPELEPVLLAATEALNGTTTITGFSSAAGVTLVESLITCDNADSAEVECTSLAVTVDVGSGPASPEPLNMILNIRRAHGVPLDNRWIVFDVGGKGGSYGKQSGNLGGYTPGGGQADDLIRTYNDLGYVTLDLTWYCDTASNACTADEKAWVQDYVDANGDDMAQGWFKDTNGLGYDAAARRLIPIYDWVQHHNGGKRVGAHAHSSGTGKLISAMVRHGLGGALDTVVFDGGPVFTYFPWYCEVNEGPLGPRPEDAALARRYVLSDLVPGAGRKAIFDMAADLDNGFGGYSACSDRAFEQKMLDNSAFLNATTRSFPNTTIGIVLGGKDNSPANSHARLWLQGYDASSSGGPNIPGISAESIRVQQGYCPYDAPDTFRQQGVNPELACSLWDPAEFLTADIVYDPSLVDVTHSTSAAFEGAEAMKQVMLAGMPAADQ